MNGHHTLAFLAFVAASAISATQPFVMFPGKSSDYLMIPVHGVETPVRWA